MPNLKLEPIDVGDAELIYSWRSEQHVRTHNPLLPIELEDFKKVLSNTSSDLSQINGRLSYRWKVDLAGQAIGTVSIKSVNTQMMFAEIGYGITETYQGKGYGGKAVELLVRKAFSETPLRKLLAYVHVENEPSCRLLKKLGFQIEGRLREHFIINDQAVDEYLFGILKRDFKYQ